MTDFVLGYPEKKGQVFADTIEELTPGEVPLLLQYDPRWGYASYGDNCLAVTGCGPTCLSMVASALTGDASLTPRRRRRRGRFRRLLRPRFRHKLGSLLAGLHGLRRHKPRAAA